MTFVYTFTNVAYFTAMSPQELLASNAVAVVSGALLGPWPCLAPTLPHALPLFCAHSDLWREAAGLLFLGHACLRGTFHFRRDQWLPVHLLQVTGLGKRGVQVRQGRCPSAGNHQCPGMQTVLKARGREILPSGARLKLGQ